MNIALNLKFKKLNDLCDQIFDYFHLVYYDLETKIDNELNINRFKNKLETFADKHFKSAINEFDHEIQKLKKNFPNELMKLEKLSNEVQQSFNQLIDFNFSDNEVINSLRFKVKNILVKIR